VYTVYRKQEGEKEHMDLDMDWVSDGPPLTFPSKKKT
jgi:hypothetical protein